MCNFEGFQFVQSLQELEEKMQMGEAVEVCTTEVQFI